MTKKIAAVWARVSTPKQGSLEGDVVEVKPWLEGQGYIVPGERILMTDWSSLSLMDCPDMQKLWRWVKNEEISAIGMFDRDRLHAEPAHKLLFLEDCEKHGVKILAKYGPPLYEGDEGRLIEHALTLGKKKQVLRAQISSKVHLRERATVKGLPTTCQPPYGYRWDETRTTLLATADWQTRRLIVRLFLEGGSIHGIRRELHERIIPSPTGLEWWPEPTIWGILVDSVNCGEYQALRRESIEPERRRGKRNGKPTYGKTSSKRLPGIQLPNIKVENPVCTKAEQDWIWRRLEQNQLNAKRNGKHDFLLRGIIYYELDNRCYHGRYIRDGIWAYEYPENGQYRKNHPRPYINGPKVEVDTEAKATKLLTSEAVIESEVGRSAETIRESIANVQSELCNLERQCNANINAEAQLLVDRNRYGENISDEAFKRALGRLQVERIHLTERQSELTAQLESLRETASSLVGLEQLREKLNQRLASREFADRRFILEALGTRVKVTIDGRLEIEFTIPREISEEAIVFSSPLNACPQYSVVPLTPL